jgi:hypothetical protein
MSSNTLALFTTVYPEGVEFLPDFFHSLAAQTDTQFDLWVGLDRIHETEVSKFFSGEYPVVCIERKPEESNIALRQRAVEQIIEQYQGILFVDSDDILAPTRVSVSRSLLDHYDVCGCAMKIIGEDGSDLHISFGIPPTTDISSLIHQFNIFGLSNTSYSTGILRTCLPFPDDCVLLDWFLATRAWLQGARMYFDPTELMLYRQWSLNTARVVPPFTPAQILLSTERVLHHYHCVLHDIPELSDSKRVLFEDAQSAVTIFYESIKKSPALFQEYLRRLNQLPPNHIWWVCVAHPELEDLWKN